jgi:hypothetical protein
MHDPQFSDRMLEETFEFARLTINSAILLNGAAATALLAFGAQRPEGLTNAVGTALVCFAFGAGLGGITALFAYVGQRCNWEHSKGTTGKRSSGVAASALLTIAILTCLASYAAFALGCWHGAALTQPPSIMV